MRRPYVVQDENAVNVMGHHNERVQLNRLPYQGTCGPLGFQHVPIGVQTHLVTGNLAEQIVPSVCADSDEVGACARVVVLAQSQERRRLVM